MPKFRFLAGYWGRAIFLRMRPTAPSRRRIRLRAAGEMLRAVHIDNVPEAVAIGLFVQPGGNIEKLPHIFKGFLV